MLRFLYRLKSIVTVCTISVFIVSCSVGDVKEQKCIIFKPDVIIDSSTWYYQGPGAAASFMLMSSSGPMGAAIGVAIDQGMQKDLLSGIDDPAQIVQLAAEDFLMNSHYITQSEEGTDDSTGRWTVQWNKFGFQSNMSDQRLTTPVMDVSLLLEGEVYNSYSLINGEAKSYPLDELSGNVELIDSVLKESTMNVMSRVRDDIYQHECQNQN